MILIRDVFQLKFGKARDALAAFKEMSDHAKKVGWPGGPPRLLTDLVGQYYTLVMETTAKDLKTWESDMHTSMGDSEWRTLYGKFTPLVESGHREIFTIHEV